MVPVGVWKLLSHGSGTGSSSSAPAVCRTFSTEIPPLSTCLAQEIIFVLKDLIAESSPCFELIDIVEVQIEVQVRRVVLAHLMSIHAYIAIVIAWQALNLQGCSNRQDARGISPAKLVGAIVLQDFTPFKHASRQGGNVMAFPKTC